MPTGPSVQPWRTSITQNWCVRCRRSSPLRCRASLTKNVRAQSLKLDDLREQLATALDVEEPKPVQLRRVRLVDVGMWALMLLAINVFVSWVLTIDMESLLDELSEASIAWLLVGLIVVQFTNLADTMSLMAVVTHPLPFAPTMQFQYATNYIGLAVPSDAGRIAMTIRYLQKVGVPTKVAVGQGPFTTVFGYVIDVILLLVAARVVGTSLEVPDDVDFSRFVTLVVIIAVVAVAGVVDRAGGTQTAPRHRSRREGDRQGTLGCVD